MFPVRINEGGGLYGFCPGKSTWDPEATSLFELLLVASEQKVLLVPGGISDQPTWFISLLAWFAPAYDTQKFVSRAKMVLGDDTKDGGSKNPPSKQRKR